MNTDKTWEIDILEEGLKSDIDLSKINLALEFLLKELSSENIQENITEMSLTLCSDDHEDVSDKERIRMEDREDELLLRLKDFL